MSAGIGLDPAALVSPEALLVIVPEPATAALLALGLAALGGGGMRRCR